MAAGACAGGWVWRDTRPYGVPSCWIVGACCGGRYDALLCKRAPPPPKKNLIKHNCLAHPCTPTHLVQGVDGAGALLVQERAHRAAEQRGAAKRRQLAASEVIEDLLGDGLRLGAGAGGM